MTLSSRAPSGYSAGWAAASEGAPPGVGNRLRRPPRTSARSGYLPDPCTSTSPERLSRPPPGGPWISSASRFPEL